MAHDEGPQETVEMERIDRDVLVSASPGDVWKVITGDGWLAERVALDLTPGGDARFSDLDGQRTGWVEEAREPSGDDQGRLVFWWGLEGEPATRVELTLTPEAPGRTCVRVIESRPLEALELVGLTLPGQSGISRGAAMLAVA